MTETIFCKACNKNISKGYYSKHLKKKKHLSAVEGVEKVYKCKDCDYETKIYANYWVHCKTHKEHSQYYYFKCTCCNVNLKAQYNV